jgi:hypothetical protein
MIETLVFLGAFTAYTGLGISTTLTFRDVFHRRLAWGVALVVTAHVFGVWAHRYEWQFDQAVRNGYGGFLLFHTALTAINAALFTPDRISRVLHRVAFVVVSMGAVGATFRYDVVSVYRIPVLIVLILTAALSYRLRKATQGNSIEVPA